MKKSPKEYAGLVVKTVNAFDKKETAALCNDLVNDLYRSGEVFPVQEAKTILQSLRRKRWFPLMEEVADALIQSGCDSYSNRRQLAQSLIDQHRFTSARIVLDSILTDISNIQDPDVNVLLEKSEAEGLQGRLDKQLYMNAGITKNPRINSLLQQSVATYLDAYTYDPDIRLWHGINATACLVRARKDGFDMSAFPDPQQLARDILTTVEEKHALQQADTWDFATAAEACIALNNTDEALQWLNRYVTAPYTDAFEIGSTLRQFVEVWQLTDEDKTGQLLLPLLRAELLKREGGSIEMSTTAIRQQEKNDPVVARKYEKVFSDSTFINYQWYKKGLERFEPIARIGLDVMEGKGTGFLLPGKLLHKDFPDEPLLLTNAHVVSNDPAVNAFRPEHVVISFEALDRQAEFHAGDILWSSSPEKLDVTIIRFPPGEQEQLKKLAGNIRYYPLAKNLPLANESERIYVLGHPKGGPLKFSMQDNLLLDHDHRLLHYRTPTEPGNSGSPVFNALWELIGIHHAGDREMPMLNGKQGLYEANEGIAIQQIILSIEEELKTSHYGNIQINERPQPYTVGDSNRVDEPVVRDDHEKYQPAQAAPPPKMQEPESPQPVLLGAAAPAVAAPGQNFTARFTAYIEALENEVVAQIKKLSPKSAIYTAIKKCTWQKDVQVTVRLSGDQLTVEPAEQSFHWNGAYEILEFDVTVSKEAPETTTVLKFDVLISEVVIARLRVDLEISNSKKNQETKTAWGKPIQSAFASYASQDRDIVLHRLSEISRNGIDVFLDCLSIRPGEKWKPVLEEQIRVRESFMLFWSLHAKRSEWVTWEWQTALKHRGLDGIDPHPLEYTPEASPPEELKDLHFGDFYMLIVGKNKPS